jgi:hypothetical protein
MNYSDHLGAFNSYYKVDNNGEIITYCSFKEALEKQQIREIDLSSVICILSKNHILGDKTLLKGLYRAPWMCELIENHWRFHDLPPHEGIRYSTEYIGKHLFELLCDEIQMYIGEKSTVGILLSGGMDSRMVAGALDYLIKSKRINVDSVTAYTWGNHDSRDVVYSKLIAERLGWNWKHYIVDAEKLWRNIEIAGERGCEYSGIHLHAMPDVGLDAANEVEVILAGSYGDGVGRAEYSGKHASKLSSIQNGIGKFSYLLNIDNLSNYINELNQEVLKYHRQFPRNNKSAQHELDRQLHYMRKMLNPCMEVINEQVPIFQVFTSPKVFGFMWSLDFSVRNNDIYKEVPKYFKTDLSDIPWARTGKLYGDLTETEDNFKKKHHSYEQFLQNNLYSKLLEQVSQSKSSLINLKELKRLVQLVNKYQGHNFDYLEAITWCISFLKIEKEEKLQIPNNKNLFMPRLKNAYVDYFFTYYGRQIKRLLN